MEKVTEDILDESIPQPETDTEAAPERPYRREEMRRPRRNGLQQLREQVVHIVDTITYVIDRYIYHRHCPYCFAYVSRSRCRRVSHRERRGGNTGQARTIKTYECQDCHAVLPSDFFASRSTSIALVGGTNAGKSTFITVFCELLLNRRSTLDELGIIGSIINKEGEDQFLYNHSILIGQQLALQGTTTVQEPVVVCLRSNHHKRSTYITLMDSPGEQFNDVNDLIALHPNLQYADGIVYLMNPLDIPELQQLIRDEKQGVLPANTANAPNFKIIETLYELYLRNGRVKPNRAIKMPVAFCLSRADLLENVGNLSMPPDFDPDLAEPGSILEEMKMVTEDLQQLLEETDPKLLNIMRRLFKQYGIFPVSPLGKMPVNDVNGQRIPRGVNPKGVLQPIIWILCATKFIKQQ